MGAKICLLVLLGEVENLFVGDNLGCASGCFLPGEGRAFAWRLWDIAVSRWCWSGGAEDPGAGISGGDKKSLKVPNTALDAAERDRLMLAPALVIPGGFEYPALRAAGCSAEGGHRFQTQKCSVFCFLYVSFSSKSSCLAEQQQRLCMLFPSRDTLAGKVRQ